MKIFLAASRRSLQANFSARSVLAIALAAQLLGPACSSVTYSIIEKRDKAPTVITLIRQQHGETEKTPLVEAGVLPNATDSPPQCYSPHYDLEEPVYVFEEPNLGTIMAAQMGVLEKTWAVSSERGCQIDEQILRYRSECVRPVREAFYRQVIGRTRYAGMPPVDLWAALKEIAALAAGSTEIGPQRFAGLLQVSGVFGSAPPKSGFADSISLLTASASQGLTQLEANCRQYLLEMELSLRAPYIEGLFGWVRAKLDSVARGEEDISRAEIDECNAAAKHLESFSRFEKEKAEMLRLWRDKVGWVLKEQRELAENKAGNFALMFWQFTAQMKAHVQIPTSEPLGSTETAGSLEVSHVFLLSWACIRHHLLEDAWTALKKSHKKSLASLGARLDQLARRARGFYLPPEKDYLRKHAKQHLAAKRLPSASEMRKVKENLAQVADRHLSLLEMRMGDQCVGGGLLGDMDRVSSWMEREELRTTRALDFMRRLSILGLAGLGALVVEEEIAVLEMRRNAGHDLATGFIQYFDSSMRKRLREVVEALHTESGLAKAVADQEKYLSALKGRHSEFSAVIAEFRGAWHDVGQTTRKAEDALGGEQASIVRALSSLPSLLEEHSKRGGKSGARFL